MSIYKSNVLLIGRSLSRAVLPAITALWLAFAPLLTAHAAGGPLDIVVLLDNSSSMQRHDPDFRVRTLLEQFIGDLPADSRVGVMLYDRGVVPAIPLSPADRDTVVANLGGLDYSGRHSNAASATERAIYELSSQGREAADLGIVLLMDGPIDTGDPDRDFDYSRWLREILGAEAASAGIRIYGIALSEDADIQVVQTLAHTTGGTYLRAAGIDDLGMALRTVGVSLGGIETPARQSETDAAIAEPPTRPATAPAVVEAESPGTETLAVGPGADRAPLAPPRAESAAMDRQAVEPGEEPPAPGTPAPIARIVEASGQALVWARQNPIPMVVAAALLVAGLLTGMLRRRTSRPSPTSEPEVPPGQVAFTPPCMLEDVSGASRRQNYDITGKLTWISRAPGDESGNARTIAIRDDLISRDHAVIEYRNYGYWISDRGSVNGTWVNGERLVEERRLKNGDRIRFARFEFLCSMPQREDMDETVMAAAAATVIAEAPAMAPGADLPRHGQPEPPEPSAAAPARPSTPAPPARPREIPGHTRVPTGAPPEEKPANPREGKRATPKAEGPNLFARTNTQEQPAAEPTEHEASPRTEQMPAQPVEAETSSTDRGDGEKKPESDDTNETIFAETLKHANPDREEARDGTVVRPARKD
jgi:hypothetical protein